MPQSKLFQQSDVDADLVATDLRAIASLPAHDRARFLESLASALSNIGGATGPRGTASLGSVAEALGVAASALNRMVEVAVFILQALNDGDKVGDIIADVEGENRARLSAAESQALGEFFAGLLARLRPGTSNTDRAEDLEP